MFLVVDDANLKDDAPTKAMFLVVDGAPHPGAMFRVADENEPRTSVYGG